MSYARAQATQSDGLDALSDDALLEELASRGLDSLLDYAFVVNKTPAEKQTGVKTIIALRRLGDPAAKLTAPQRQKLVADAVRGIELALPSMHDPKLMIRQASDLIAAGVERDVNTLEYWGDNPRTQANLRPVVQTVIRLLERCLTESTEAANNAANKIRSPDDKASIARFEGLEQLAKEAEYTRYMTDYYLVLAIDRADPQRRAIASKAIDALKQYDTPDQPIRARVRNRIGKFAMSTGDFDLARQMFDSVSQPASASDFQPPPDASLQYEARYFRAVTDLLASETDEAMHGLDALEQWQRGNLPSPENATSAEARIRAKAAREGASAAAAMLRYRILSAKSDLARAPADKKKFNDDAVSTLYALLKEQPSLQSIIYDQLMSKLPSDAKMDGLDTLLLQALIRRGEGEVRRPDGAAVDRPTLERGLAAARELVGRSNVDPPTMESASLLIGLFLDRLHRDAEAADSLLNFIEKNRASGKAPVALDNAQAIIGQMRRDKPEDAAVASMYERFLSLAIAAPFNRKQFAYEYARRLQLQGKPDDAIKYFELVPRDDKRSTAARFFQTIALQQQLDAMKPGDPQRAALVSRIQSLADEVNASIGAAMSAAANDDERNSFRSMLVRTTLLAAEMARAEQNDPKRALSLLNDFEQKITGLPDANRRMTDALLVRVQALMATDQYAAATEQLVHLLDREPNRGGGIVFDLLTKLNEELDKAQATGGADQVRAIARNRAQLTGFLVQWARNNANPSVKKLAYGYAVFDAEVQRFAAEHEADATARDAGLNKALDLFTKLNTPENVEQYIASLSADQKSTAAAQPSDSSPNTPTTSSAPTAPPTYDPAVILGLARTNFDLQHWTESRDAFSRLLSDRRLGPPVTISEDHGVEREIDNENYWEAVFKLIRSNLALNNGIEESKNYLKQQFIRWGDRVGGKKWKDEYAKLRTEIIPDFDANAVLPATVPTTSQGSGDAR